jgi:hypothetical protein
MSDNLPYKEKVKYFNAVMNRALATVSPPLLLDELEIKVLSCHRSLQTNGLEIPEHEHPNYELTFKFHK